MPRLTEVQRGQAIALLMQDQRQQQVALQFGVNVSTTERLVHRLRDTGRVVDHPQRGCLRVMTPRQDRTIYLTHQRYRHITATETALITVGNHNCHIHPKTVRNRLREFGLRACRPYIGFPLTRARRTCHMAWLVAHGPRQFPMRQWRRVFFTDESQFTLFRPDGRRHVCRPCGERFADACILERDRFGGGSVMVWGGISHGLKSLFIVIAGNVTGARNRDEILQSVAVPFVKQHHQIFQQDNAGTV